MKFELKLRLGMAIGLISLLGLTPIASASGTTLSIRTTTLGKIVVNGKGMTAYYYDLDKINSGVSACTGSCLVNWPPIISASPTSVGITGKVTVLAGTKQIAINGRPIYTFIGDSTAGATRGQGLEGIWYVISPAGVELNPVNLAKAHKTSASPSPTKNSRY
jgi:predicted lipoprotein with Yx(FWY)xxD motif